MNILSYEVSTARGQGQSTIDECPLTLVNAPLATNAVKQWLEANF